MALMATEDPAVDTEPKHANWSAVEVGALIQYLHAHCVEWANTGNFCQSTYANAVEHICLLHVTGKIKDHKNIKQTYNVVITYHSKLGKHWDNDHGTNISGALAGENWSKYITVKANVLMKPFHNKGWEYMEYLEDIFPQGGATSTHAFHAGTSQYTIPSASTDNSISTPIHSHFTPATSIASIGPAAPTSNLPASNPPISNPPTPNSPAPNPPALNPTAPNSGGKCSFAVMSSEVADTTSPLLLFLDNCPPQTGKAKSQASHMVTVIAIDNMIQHLGDQLETMFMDPLITVQTATTMIYKDPEMPTLHHAFMMHQFTGNSNSAAAYISLPDDEAWHAYVADLYANLNEVGLSSAPQCFVISSESIALATHI
ncbi:hypothetical protein EDC04DRAFT_2981189 [Pisolithus marmoratus]|nr:hypothetical protein EDC04DRAFT_2981189 [Pisolithus marmoratus]